MGEGGVAAEKHATKAKVKVSMFDYAKKAWDIVVGEGVLRKDQLPALAEEASKTYPFRKPEPARFFIVLMESDVAHALKALWGADGADKVYGSAPSLSLHFCDKLRDYFFASEPPAGRTHSGTQ